MVVYEIIYFKAYTNDQFMCHKNNIAQLYFMLETAKLLENFSSTSKDGSDIHRFFNKKCIFTMCNNGNL